MAESRAGEGWRRWWVAAVEAGAGVGLVDSAVAMGRFGERLPNERDRLAFALSVSGVSALAFALLALAVCGLWSAAQRAPSWARPVLGQAAAIGGGLLLGFAVFSGTSMRHSPGRPWAILACAALASLLTQALGPRVARSRMSPPARVALLGVSAVLYVVHAFAYVRLYPGVHAFLAAGAVATLIAAIAYGVREPISAPVALVTLAVAAGGAAGAANLHHAQAQRALAAHRAPVAGYAVRALDALLPRATVTAALPSMRRVGGASLDFEGQDLVLVTIDALRADRLGAYGSTRGLTPALDALAATGVVFERAYCTTPHTSYSVASLMTGKYLRELSALGPPAHPHETLAALLAARGYRTAGFFPPAVFNVDGERLGDLASRRFDFADVFEGYVDAGPRVDEVARWLDRVPRGQRVFAWVHFFEPHEPYVAHRGGRASVSENAPPAARYDAEVAAVDDAFARLRTVFESRGRTPAWVITGDHGEEFGEHGGRFHGTTLYDEQIRVPLVLAAPHLAPSRLAGPVSLVDVAPTLLAAVGAPVVARMRGADLGPQVLAQAPSAPVFASAETASAVVDGHEKLICDRGGGPCELFDLASDPREVANQIDARPARARALASLLEGWTSTHGRLDDVSPRAPSPHDAEIERAMQGDPAAAVALARAFSEPGDAYDNRRAAGAVLALLVANPASPALDHDALTSALATAIAAPDPAIRRDAGIALTLLGDPRGSEPAHDALDVSDVLRRRAAALGLATLGRKDGLDVLVSWIQDERASGRERAAHALSVLAAPETAPVWRALLDDPLLSPEAAQALGTLGDRNSVTPLEHAAETTPYALTLHAAVRSLATLGAPSAARYLARELALPDLAPGAADAALALGEPGRTLPGSRWERGLVVSPGHAATVSARGRVPAGPGFAILLFEPTPAGARVRIDGQDVELLPGATQLRVAVADTAHVIRLEADRSLRLRALIVVARDATATPRS